MSLFGWQASGSVVTIDEGAWGEEARSSALPVALGAGAGTMTMVALCFANGLQGGASQTFAQATDALKHTYHVNDAAIGVIPFGVALAGNLGAVPIAALCARHRRTIVLAGMFIVWGVLLFAASLAPVFSVFGLAAAGFVVFAVFRISSAFLEATDPAVYPLISDWWPVEQRASKISIFNTLSAVGGFGGLIIAGVLVDAGAWRWAFALWLPLALVGAVLIRSREEPTRGSQDVRYRERLESETEGEEHEQVVEAVEHPPAAPVPVSTPGDRWAVVRAVSRLRSWRRAAIGVALSGIMGSGFMYWGLPYFKRTFHLSGTEAAGLAPILGVGAFAGVLGGGFLADRLLERGVLRGRLYVTAAGMAGGGLFLIAAFTTTSLAVAAPLLGIGTGLYTLPMGPQFAMMMDVTPPTLRSQASAALNVLQASGALGAVLIGGFSTLFGENLRLALLCVSPFFLLGAVVVFSARRTYVEDVALVVAEAEAL